MNAFLELHRPGEPLLMPNAWDAGSARILASLGFAAVATTSSGFAATLGRRDGRVTRDEALAHAAALTAAVEVPVSADLEAGYGATRDDVATTVRLAADTGLAGLSIEDHPAGDDASIYPLAVAVERLQAAREAAPALVLTGRCENHLYGVADLADTIARLLAYQEAGADVLYAPGLTDLADVRRVVAEVQRPVNVLLARGGPTPAELADVGVARISVGGAFAWNALTGLVEAANDLLTGSTAFLERGATGRAAAENAC